MVHGTGVVSDEAWEAEQAEQRRMEEGGAVPDYATPAAGGRPASTAQELIDSFVPNALRHLTTLLDPLTAVDDPETRHSLKRKLHASAGKDDLRWFRWQF